MIQVLYICVQTHFLVRMYGSRNQTAAKTIAL